MKNSNIPLLGGLSSVFFVIVCELWEKLLTITERSQRYSVVIGKPFFFCFSFDILFFICLVLDGGGRVSLRKSSGCPGTRTVY